jgi:hypothetical protein
VEVRARERCGQREGRSWGESLRVLQLEVRGREKKLLRVVRVRGLEHSSMIVNLRIQMPGRVWLGAGGGSQVPVD